MNNRFLFRVMNKETKKYEHHSVVEESSVFLLSRVSSKYIVEQCTGLKDANGNLIYEGDMLLLDPDAPPALVVWSEDVAMFCLEQEDVCYTFDNCGYSPQEMEVIGNIHENPELLEGK